MSEPEIDYSERIAKLEQKIQGLEKLADRIELLEDKISLVTDIDRYQKLQELLAAKDFKAADLETNKLILGLTEHFLK
jgi:hypothetical protein